MAQVKLRFDIGDYKAPEILLGKHSAKELRVEYSRLRSIARKRLERMGASDFKKTQTYKRYKSRFTALPNIKTARTIARKLVEVKKFLGLRESSVSGQKELRKERIRELQESGYEWINDDNFDLFTDFMDYNRELRKGGEYDSDRVTSLVKNVYQKGLDPDEVQEEFDYWMSNVEALKDVPAPPKGTAKKKASEFIKEQLKDVVIEAVKKGMA